MLQERQNFFRIIDAIKRAVSNSNEQEQLLCIHEVYAQLQILMDKPSESSSLNCTGLFVCLFVWEVKSHCVAKLSLQSFFPPKPTAEAITVTAGATPSAASTHFRHHTQGNANPPVSLKALLPEENPLGVGQRAEDALLWTSYFCRSVGYDSFRCARKWFWELGGSSVL